MKDMLGRDIMVGDKLACAAYHNNLGASIDVYEVLAVATFALQAKKDSAEFPVVFPRADQLVICDWAKGSDAAK